MNIQNPGASRVTLGSANPGTASYEKFRHILKVGQKCTRKLKDKTRKNITRKVVTKKNRKYKRQSRNKIR